MTTALNSLAYGDLGWSDRKLLWRWNADQTHVGVCNLWHQSWQPASISLSSRFLSLMNVQTGLHAEEEVFIFITCSTAVCPWACGAVSDSQKCLIPSAPTLLSFAHSCSCAKTSWMCAQYVVQYFQGLHHSPEPPKLWRADWHGYWGVPRVTSQSCQKKSHHWTEDWDGPLMILFTGRSSIFWVPAVRGTETDSKLKICIQLKLGCWMIIKQPPFVQCI